MGVIEHGRGMRKEESDGSIGHGWYEYTRGTQSERLRGKSAIKRIDIWNDRFINVARPLPTVGAVPSL